MRLNETTGHVEITIRDFTSLMLRLDAIIRRMDEFFGEEEQRPPEAVMSSADSKMTREEFVAFTQEWLTEKKKKCAVFRFAGRWSHVNDRSEVTGSWPTIDEAIDATSCDNDCPPKTFGPREAV